MVGIRGVQNYSSDHFSLQVRLLHIQTQYHRSYLWRRLTFTLSLPMLEDFIISDKKSQEFKDPNPNPPILTLPPTPPMDIGEICLVD